jgi:hypothetical protein
MYKSYMKCSFLKSELSELNVDIDYYSIPLCKNSSFGQSPSFRNDGRDRQVCDLNSKFRTLVGTCNNVGVPSFGKSGTIFNRLVFNPSEGYDDGELKFLLHFYLFHFRLILPML